MYIEKKATEIAHEFSPRCRGGRPIFGHSSGVPVWKHSTRCKELALRIRVFVDEAVRLQNEAWQKSQMGQNRKEDKSDD